MKFSIASIVGATFGFAMLLGAIAHGTSNYLAFLSLEGVLIVVGGSLAVAFMSFQANHVMDALKAIRQMFMQTKPMKQIG